MFDLDSIGLLKLVNGLNGGVDPAGRDFGGQARFFCATGGNFQKSAFSDFPWEGNTALIFEIFSQAPSPER